MNNSFEEQYAAFNIDEDQRELFDSFSKGMSLTVNQESEVELLTIVRDQEGVHTSSKEIAYAKLV